MAGTYALANNTTLTDGNGGSGAVVNLSGKYADSIINQNIDSDNEIFYQGGFALSTNTNRRANRENSLLLDTTTTGANTITDVAGYVLQMWVFIPFFTNHGVGFNVTNWAGVQAVVADGGTSGTANINTYRVDGNDVNVKGGWQLYVVDLRNTPTGPDSNLSVASLGSAGRAPRYVGWTHSTRGFALRRDPLAALDCARFGRMQLNATGGTNTNILPSDPENSSAANFMQMAAYDDNNNNSPANGTAVDGGFHKFGVCEPSLESNGYIMRGVWSLGTSATSVFFEDYNSSINVRDEFLTYDDFNRIEVRNASSTVNLINTNGSLVFKSEVITSQNAAYAPAQPRGNFEMVDNATVTMTGCAWSDMGTFIFQSNATLTDTTFRRTDLVTQGGSSLERCAFEDSRAAASLLANDLGNVSECTFVSDGSNHAVELTSIGTGSYTWDHTTSDYAAGTLGVEGTDFTAGSTGNETLYINATSSQNITLTIPSGITTPSIRRGASYTGTITLEAQAKTIDVNVKDADGVNVVGAFVYINDGVTTIFNGTTDASGNIPQQSYSGTNNSTLRVRRFGDKPFETTLGTASGSVSQLVTLIDDRQQIAVPTLNNTWTIDTSLETITMTSGPTLPFSAYSAIDTSQNLYEFVMNTFAATAFMQFEVPLESVTDVQYNFVNGYTFGAKDNDYKFLYSGSFTDATNNLLWSNVKTIGTVETGTGIYVVQGVEASDTALTSWWPDGNVDILIKVQDGTFIQSTDDTATNVDGGVWLFAREYGDLYDHFFTDLSIGGQSIVALSTNEDLNNTTASGTVSAYTDITLTFGSLSRDIGDGNGNQPYAAEVDCNGRPLAEVYEYLKYITSFDFSQTVNGDDGYEYRNADEANFSNVDNKQAPFGTFAGGRFFGAQGVFITNMAGSDSTNYELIDSNGVQRFPPLTVTFELTGLKDGTEVRIYNAADTSDVAGVETITAGSGSGATAGVTITGTADDSTFAYQYIYSSDINIIVVVVNLNFQNIYLEGFTLTDTNQSIPIAQVIDRQYLNP